MLTAKKKKKKKKKKFWKKIKKKKISEKNFPENFRKCLENHVESIKNYKKNIHCIENFLAAEGIFKFIFIYFYF